jgi:hypothetical protein
LPSYREVFGVTNKADVPQSSNLEQHSYNLPEKNKRHLEDSPIAGGMSRRKLLMPGASYWKRVTLCCKYVIFVLQE